jgi:hypothetical protein
MVYRRGVAVERWESVLKGLSKYDGPEMDRETGVRRVLARPATEDHR